MRKIIRISWLTTFLTLLAGFLLAFFEVMDYGISFFVIFPIGVGFSAALMTPNDRKIAKQLVFVLLGLIAFLAFALAAGLEGLICVFMALPLIAFLLVIGFFIAIISKATILKKYNEENDVMYAVFLPIVLLVAGNFVEKLVSGEPRINTITTSIILPYNAYEVFDAVKSMDTLNGKKPLLLQMGLPTPYKCLLEDTAVGATRTCLFPDGKVVSEITTYEPGKKLEMKVTNYTITGHRWFSFRDASYTLEPAGDATKITRISTYTSLLRPRVYWKMLEKYAIDQEHRFVLGSVGRNLEFEK